MKVSLGSLRFPLRCYLHHHWHTEPIMEISINFFDVIPSSYVHSITYTLIFAIYRTMKLYDTIDDIVRIVKRLRYRINTDWTVIRIKTLTSGFTSYDSIFLYIDTTNYVHFNSLPCPFTAAIERLDVNQPRTASGLRKLFAICADMLPYSQRLYMKEQLALPYDIMPSPVSWIIA